MIEDMADGLIDRIRDRLPLAGREVAREGKYKWVKIYDMRKEYAEKQRIIISEMEVLGKRISIKKERKKEKLIFGNYAATIIQKNVRMWLAKKHL